MSQAPQREKKNRFQISREVQEEFVNGIARTMLSLAQTAGEWKQAWATDTPLGMPFCPVTGREYSGANMVRLLLTGMEKGYADDRWMTFNQLQSVQADNPNLEMKIRKGEHGVKLLRPEEIAYIVEDDGNWKFLSNAEVKRIAEMKAQGREVPEVERKTLFYPFTVFNAAQIEGFPAKERITPCLSEIERNEFVERFIASSGVSVEHHNGDPCFKHDTDVVRLPHPDRFTGTDEYYAAKLHEFFHATGHASRENRQKKGAQTLKGYAFEEMRAEMFSMLAGARLNLPMPESNSAAYIAHWNRTFSGGDAKAVFQAASEAAKILSVLHQYEAGEEPSATWFPRRKAWPELIAMQKQRDAASGVSYRQDEESGSQVFTPVRRPAPPSFAESAAAFKKTDNPVIQARLILQNPDFLGFALKLDPSATRELAALCDQVSQALHMEMDARLQSAPGAVENPLPLNEQKAASARRMRM